MRPTCGRCATGCGPAGRPTNSALALKPYSESRVLPRVVVPIGWNMRAKSPSAAAGLATKARVPCWVGRPPTSLLSLTKLGWPAKKPSWDTPASASAWENRSAASPSSSPSSLRVRSMDASTTSRRETRPERISSARPTASWSPRASSTKAWTRCGLSGVMADNLTPAPCPGVQGSRDVIHVKRCAFACRWQLIWDGRPVPVDHRTTTRQISLATTTAARTNAPEPTPGTGPESGEYTHAQILTILSGLLLGMFLAALDQSIVGTSIRTIADDLHGLSIQAWVTTAYLITSTITTPIYGKLRRPLRPQEAVPVRDHAVHRRLGGVLVRRLHVRAGRAPRRTGARRRRPVHARARDHRRHRLAARAREVHRLLHGRLRHLERARPGRRRPVRRPGDDPRHHRLALGVPGQRADRHRSRCSSSTGTCTSTTCAASPGSTGGAPRPWWSRWCRC